MGDNLKLSPHRSMPAKLDNEQSWAKLQAQSTSCSLLKKHLTAEVYEELKGKETKFGSKLADCISSGVNQPTSSVGVYAADAECYSVFAKLFTPIIVDYHKLDASQSLSHPPMNFGQSSSRPNLDPEGKYVVSTRVRVARNLKELPLNPTMTKEHYLTLEQKVRAVVEKFTGDMAGDYYSLATMDQKKKEQLVADHYMYKEGDKYLEDAQALNFWPAGRGIFVSKTCNFIVWVGEEDHMRIISMQKGADLGQVVSRLESAIKQCEQSFDFAHSAELGHLTFCPTNLGTTVRASVHIKLPKLSKNMDEFQKIAKANHLQIRGIHGEHSESEGGVYDISNSRRLGLTEEDALTQMYEGIKKMIEMESSM